MIEPDIAEREELAAFTLERLREALAGPDTPCVTQVIEIIRKMSDRADVLSIQDLAEAIGHDMTTMVKVMKAANCLHFNPSALEVTTVARAVSVIGFNKIQNLALSLMLLEGAENRAAVEETRDVSARALCGALLAEEVTRTVSLADPEEAFVCSALRAYGRLLVSTFLIEEYRQALTLATEMSVDRAFRLTFGLTPLEISQRILGDVNLAGIGPELFQPIGPSQLKNKHPRREDGLLLAADFAAAFTELVSEPGLTAGDFEIRAGQLLERFSAPMKLDLENLKAVVDGVRQRLDTFARSQNVAVFNSLLMQRLHQIADGAEFVPAPAAGVPGAAGGRRPATKSDTEFESRLAASRGPLAAAAKKVEALMAEQPVDVPKVLLAASTGIRKSLRLDHCVVFLREMDGTRYAATAGEGALFGRIQGQPLVDPARRDVFTVCLAQGEDVLIQDPTEGRIAPFIPEWFRLAGEGAPFLLLPVKDESGVFAVICGVAGRGQRIEHGVTRLPQFRKLRSLLGRLRKSLSEESRAAA